MDGGLVHQSEGRVTQAVIAALALASLVLQSGGSTPLADTTLNNVLKGYGEKGCLHVLPTGLHRGQQHRERRALDGAPAPQPAEPTSRSCFGSHDS
jgi:hypothetical protein